MLVSDSMNDQRIVGGVGAVSIVLLALWLLSQRVANHKSVFLRQVLVRAANVRFASAQAVVRRVH